MRYFLLFVGIGFVSLFVWCSQGTAIGVLVERSGDVTIRGAWPFSSTVRGGQALELSSAGSSAKVQTEGGIQLELKTLEKADGALLKTGYWWEMGGGPYQYLDLERGRLAVTVAGPIRHRWTTDFSAPGVKIHTYGTRFLDYAVQVDGKAVTVTTSRAVKDMEVLQVSVSTTALSTTVHMEPGQTLEVSPGGLRGSAVPGAEGVRPGLPSPAPARKTPSGGASAAAAPSPTSPARP